LAIDCDAYAVTTLSKAVVPKLWYAYEQWYVTVFQVVREHRVARCAFCQGPNLVRKSAKKEPNSNARG